MDSGLAAARRPGMISSSIRNRSFHPTLEVLILLAFRPANEPDLLQEIRGLQPVTLLDLPHAVVLPGAHVLRIGRERPLVPDLREFVVAELARRVAEIIRHIRHVVGIELLESSECSIVLLSLHELERQHVAIAEFPLGLALLFCLLAGLAPRLSGLLLDRIGVAAVRRTAAAAGRKASVNIESKRKERHSREHAETIKPDHCLLLRRAATEGQ